MRVSEYYKLGRSQPSLSFVDVKIDGDVKLFVSPRAIRLLPTQWGSECIYLLQNFFGTVLELVKKKKHADAERLLQVLKEPDETHLGLSKRESRGRGLGSKHAAQIWHAFARSKAADSGLLTDLEDTVLLIRGISVDMVSDITTNIIRGPLIEFTQGACKSYGIPLCTDVASGPIWNPKSRDWETRYVDLPTTDDEKLLLVPKSIVRVDMDYDVEKYFRHYILDRLQQVEMRSSSSLVHVLKNGKVRVTKIDLEEKYGRGKAVILEQTLKNPELLAKYKTKLQRPSAPLSHRRLADIQETSPPNWDALLSSVLSVKPGLEDAVRYEDAVEALLSALFYPVLDNPNIQRPLNDGRKRVDITYTNMASRGFFEWLAVHYPAAHVFVECKNYGRKLGNPELDQLAGRFSKSKGAFGMIVCRSLRDRKRFEASCRDTAKDSKGYIVVLDDDDLEVLTKQRKADNKFFELSLIRKRFEQLIM